MTIPPISVEKSAETLVDIFGAGAPAHARERLAKFDGDAGKHGYRFWSAVANEALMLLERERLNRLPSRERGFILITPSPSSPLR